MEVKEIVESLRYNKDGKFQKEAIIEARKKQKEITEELLVELDKVANNVEKYAKDLICLVPYQAISILSEIKGLYKYLYQTYQ